MAGAVSLRGFSLAVVDVFGRAGKRSRMSCRSAPEGRRHKAWGFNPRNAPHQFPGAPKGRRQATVRIKLPAPLRGF